VIKDGVIDEAATKALRSAPRESIEGMTFDPERLSFERIWSDAVWDRLSQHLFALPVEWRFFVKHELFAAVNADAAAKDDPVAALERAHARVLEQYPQIVPRQLEDAA
jgi:N-methylhydantoinase B